MSWRTERVCRSRALVASTLAAFMAGCGAPSDTRGVAPNSAAQLTVVGTAERLSYFGHAAIAARGTETQLVYRFGSAVQLQSPGMVLRADTLVRTEQNATRPSPCQPTPQEVKGTVELQFRDSTGRVVATTGQLRPHKWMPVHLTYRVDRGEQYRAVVVLRRESRDLVVGVVSGARCVAETATLSASGLVVPAMKLDYDVPRGAVYMYPTIPPHAAGEGPARSR